MSRKELVPGRNLLRELNEEAAYLVLMLANAMESARDLRDRAAAASVLGLRDGFGDAAAIRCFDQDAVKYMVGAAARQAKVAALVDRLPE